MKKISLIILGTITLIVGIYFSIPQEQSKRNEDQPLYVDTEGLLIYGDWYFNISLLEGDDVRIQIFVFDFGESELENAKLSVDDKGILHISNTRLYPDYATSYYGVYMAEFNISSDQIGKHEIKNVELIISTPDREYNENLGDMDIEVLPRTNSIHFEIKNENNTRTYTNKSTYDFSTTFKQTNTSEKIFPKELSLVHNNRINFINSESQILENNDDKFTIKNKIDLGDNRNVVIVPQLQYTVEGENGTYKKQLSVKSFHPSFTESELERILIEKGVISEN
ncbi:hypothetical protein [Bacillus weihaiensis]|uniref:Uncharacterized protein n=1 Tax=Bacillus weihaiensis TaxID=1547283 RepID=A0A1L3MMZ0_9BACI|nr:hypothetical protein [Bacillus weihaiensis]APH03681.1 hypothetical protein A9C19_02305 [Bacillus weihaiensis]